MTKKGTIYCIQNIKDGKRYIGQTTKSLELRFKEHMTEACNPENDFTNRRFFEAIRTHGDDSFRIKPLKENVPENELNTQEMFFIDKYKTYEDHSKGYNSTPGGDCDFRKSSTFKSSKKINKNSEFKQKNNNKQLRNKNENISNSHEKNVNSIEKKKKNIKIDRLTSDNTNIKNPDFISKDNSNNRFELIVISICAIFAIILMMYLGGFYESIMGYAWTVFIIVFVIGIIYIFRFNQVNADTNGEEDSSVDTNDNSEDKIDENSETSSFDQKELENWMETLPFPIASILFAYVSKTEYDKKIDYLLYFFEALSEFNVNVMLSSISSDLNFYNENFSNCRISHTQRNKNWYLRPTFGNWNFFGSCLAKQIRRLMENLDKKEECLEIFGNPDISFVDMLSNKKLYGILEEAADYRNRWKGHGATVDEIEQKKRLNKLEKCLSRLKNIISDNYTNSKIIMPLQNTHKGGIYRYVVKNLMTTKSPFKSINLQTNMPLDSENRYLIHKKNLSAIKLLPLIKIIESPEKEHEACYFYNGMGKESADFVSYHFSKEPIIHFDINELNDVFELIK